MILTIQVHTNNLKVGMYVSGLDRPWLETPFLTQGFMLESLEDIDRVRQYCDYVYVDKARSSHCLPRRSLQIVRGEAVKALRKERRRIPVEKIFEGRKIKPYEDKISWQEEHGRAVQALDRAVTDLNRVFERIRDGGDVDLMTLKGAVNPIVESMGRNPDACMWLARMQQHHEGAYEHALSTSIWTVALGRQLGLSRLDLRSLAIGGLLLDVGKLRIDPELLESDRALTDDEAKELRRHVDYGVELLQERGVMNRDVIDMVAGHHERYDGSGYLKGLAEDQIPVMARIAAIADTYNALTRERSYAQAMSPSDAIRTIYEARDLDFQAELVEAFIQAIGVYPAGTLVELNSGEVGVVVAEYRSRRMRPKVSLLLDPDKNPLQQPCLLDLSEVKTQDGEDLSISTSLQPGAYGIDLAEFGALPMVA